MPKLQCEDVCFAPFKMGHTCCCNCEHQKKCIETGDICDSLELGIEHCPLKMEVEE